MTASKLGRLQKVELREVWASESSQFTPWLAQAENLKLLGEAIGIQLECEEQEKGVGTFRADILCKDTVTDSRVVIENQLERTDHSHLGQLLTYAAGLDALTIVWIAERFTEEHRAALDWLNEHTAEKITCFGLEVELWRIGDSPVAPKFNIVCKPNDWTRSVQQRARGELSEQKQFHLEYWTELQGILKDRNSVVRATSPGVEKWAGFPVGRTHFRLWAELDRRGKKIGVGLTCKPPHAKHFFRQLKAHQKAIEAELGFLVEWEEYPEYRFSCIVVYTAADVSDRSKWLQHQDWMVSRLEAFHRVFAPRVRLLQAPEMEDEEPSAGDKT